VFKGIALNGVLAAASVLTSRWDPRCSACVGGDRRGSRRVRPHAGRGGAL